MGQREQIMYEEKALIYSLENLFWSMEHGIAQKKQSPAFSVFPKMFKGTLKDDHLVHWPRW